MPERALQLLDEMQQQGLEPNVITYTAVISARELTLQLFDEMRLQGRQLKVITFSAVFTACGKREMPERALQLLDQMQQQRLEPGGEATVSSSPDHQGISHGKMSRRGRRWGSVSACGAFANEGIARVTFLFCSCLYPLASS